MCFSYFYGARAEKTIISFSMENGKSLFVKADNSIIMSARLHKNR